jgi:hypothetical protein
MAARHAVGDVVDLRVGNAAIEGRDQEAKGKDGNGISTDVTRPDLHLGQGRSGQFRFDRTSKSARMVRSRSVSDGVEGRSSGLPFIIHLLGLAPAGYLTAPDNGA